MSPRLVQEKETFGRGGEGDLPLNKRSKSNQRVVEMVGVENEKDGLVIASRKHGAVTLGSVVGIGSEQLKEREKRSII